MATETGPPLASLPLQRSLRVSIHTDTMTVDIKALGVYGLECVLTPDKHIGTPIDKFP